MFNTKFLIYFFPGESYKVPCPKCNLTFFNKASLKNHTKAVHEGKSGYACTICGVRYNSHFGLRRHTNYAHEKNKDIKTRNASKRLLVTGTYATIDSLIPNTRHLAKLLNSFMASFLKFIFSNLFPPNLFILFFA